MTVTPEPVTMEVSALDPKVTISRRLDRIDEVVNETKEGVRWTKMGVYK